MVAHDAPTPSGGRRLIPLTLWPASFVLLCGLVCVLVSPAFAGPLILGSLAVFLPCLVLAFLFVRVTPVMVLMLAMVRTAVVAVVILATAIAFEPPITAYLIGVLLSVFAVTVLPVVVEVLRLRFAGSSATS